MAKRYINDYLIRINGNKGVALPMALSCIMIVSILVLELTFSYQISRSLAHNDYDSLRAEYLAKSGLNISLLKLKIHKTVLEVLKDKPEITNLIISMPITYPIEAASITTENEEYIENESQDENDEENPFEGRLVATTQGVSGINLNWQLDDIWLSKENPEEGLAIYQKNVENFKEEMMKSFENKLEESRYGAEIFYRKYRDLNFEEVLNNIIDWIDKDKEAINGGFEDDYYQRQEPPYRAKNGYLDTFSELHLIQGMTDDLYKLFENKYSVLSENKVLLSDLVNMTNMMKWLSSPSLHDEEIEEIRNEFSLPESTWSSNVKLFEQHIRDTYSVDFNESLENGKKTNFVKLSAGDDINRYLIKSVGVFKKFTKTIEAVVDRSTQKNMVFLKYFIY
jgi:general secretion pathway protein K